VNFPIANSATVKSMARRSATNGRASYDGRGHLVVHVECQPIAPQGPYELYAQMWLHAAGIGFSARPAVLEYMRTYGGAHRQLCQEYESGKLLAWDGADTVLCLRGR
jgi:hypothetical protein